MELGLGGELSDTLPGSGEPIALRPLCGTNLWRGTKYTIRGKVEFVSPNLPMARSSTKNAQTMH
jgi:hypothetical protein